MCWSGHPGTIDQPTCCIRCSPINEASLAGLLLPRRFKKAAILEGESFDFYNIKYFSIPKTTQKIWIRMINQCNCFISRHKITLDAIRINHSVNKSWKWIVSYITMKICIWGTSLIDSNKHGKKERKCFYMEYIFYPFSISYKKGKYEHNSLTSGHKITLDRLTYH